MSHDESVQAVDDFLERAELERSSIRKQREHLASQLDGIRRKGEELAQREQDLDRSLRVYRDVMGIPERREAKPVGDLFGDVPMGTIAEMAEAIIKKHGRPMKVADLTRALEEIGKLSRSAESTRANYGTVYGTIRNHPSFVKTGTGEFGLTVWRDLANAVSKPLASPEDDEA